MIFRVRKFATIRDFGKADANPLSLNTSNYLELTGKIMAYKILSLDGGGTWALIQVKALLDLYGTAVTGRQILQDFDMVAANSGGSIVLGGLIEDYTLTKLLALF
jgi:patatin-like phospholipase/acyl hydrolase